MKTRKGPWGSPSAKKQMAQLSPLTAVISGEITANSTGVPLGAVNHSGRVHDVWLAVEASGTDDTDDLSATVDIMKNGTSVLSTTPIIAYVSGEADTPKTTLTSAGDTGITEAVMDVTANTYLPGDMFTYDMTLTRTSPEAEMRHIAIVVELEPGNV